MKKLLIIMTLFMSSFFLFCNKEVKADVTITNEDVETYITENFLSIKDYILKYNLKYVIIRNTNLNSTRYYEIKNTSSITVSSSTFAFSSVRRMEWNGSGFYSSNSDHSATYNLSDVKILFSSIELFPTDNFNIIFNNKNYYVGPENKFVTIYDIYNDRNSAPEENPHQEEIDKVTNFYTMVIEKINYLAEAIINNYILLFIIGIFILIFVFMLIFRRFIC